MKDIVYIAELDADVDDVVAAEYLNNKGVLKCVVCDPKPKTLEGKNRENSLKKLGIEVLYKMPPIAKYVFVGGALTELARYTTMHHIDALVMNGGFAGDNVVNKENRLKKFNGKNTIRTFNFNCDVNAADKVLKTTERQIGKIILVGKNVCHSLKNTEEYLWRDNESLELFTKYHVKQGKRQHDMLACHEGLALLNLTDDKPFCIYKELYPYNTGLKGNMTEWGSTTNNNITPYRNVITAIGYL